MGNPLPMLSIFHVPKTTRLSLPGGYLAPKCVPGADRVLKRWHEVGMVPLHKDTGDHYLGLSRSPALRRFHMTCLNTSRKASTMAALQCRNFNPIEACSPKHDPVSRPRNLVAEWIHFTLFGII